MAAAPSISERVCGATAKARHVSDRRVRFGLLDQVGNPAASKATMSACGPTRTSRHVRFSAACGERRNVLSFKHHAEVAALPPAEADVLLDRAEA